MRICLFGQGPLCEAVEAALEAQGHTLLGPFSSPQPTEVLKGTQASVGLSCGYRHKFTPEEWECFPDGILNLHTGYLPWNKGAYPNVWPILDGSPAGVTLHRVDAGIDTGPILAQTRVEVEPQDTAKTLYDKLLGAGVELAVQAFRFAEQRYRIVNGVVVHAGFTPGTAQDPNAGSFHRKRDLPSVAMPGFHQTHHRPILDCEGCVAENIRLLRACSFPGYGLRYRQDGKLIEATITLKEVTE